MPTIAADDGDATTEPAPAEVDPDARIRLLPLTYLAEGDEVTVGCAAANSYAVLPADGAALLRRLGEGSTLGKAGDWYQETYGEPVDLAEFIEAIVDLGFVDTAYQAAGHPSADHPSADYPSTGHASAAPSPVRWARLGRVVFSPLSGLCLLALAALTVASMVRHPDLVPGNDDLFFTRYMSVMELVTFLGQFPLLLLHESFHALAGRRLGLASRLSIGRRLYYVVFLTEMDGLVTVPRRKRYVPMLAGMTADLLVIMILTLSADATRRADGSLSLAGGILLALSYTTVLRLLWQFFFYIETDLYYVFVTVLGCVDLQATARGVLRNRWHRLRRKPQRMTDPAVWHPRDRSVARWYSWLLLAGWTFSFASLGVIVIPVAVRVLSKVGSRLDDPSAQTVSGLLDSVVFLSLNLAQLCFALWLAVRAHRSRRAAGTAATAATATTLS